jgi:hypothetical protein
MILKTGNKKSFSLIEVLSAVAVLSLGFVFIYQAFFVFLDLFSYYKDYLKLGFLLDEKLWEIEQIFRYNPQLQDIQTTGKFQIDNKDFYWNLNYELIDKESSLYRIDLSLTGKEGRRKINIWRSGFIFYQPL